ncbi:hypothetical protein [Catellatospora sichuanensis]|uniref:hypothetical protein n=1 Tax=Catellatospora sichuanensis TaxID=1969805 RepID=UPI001C92875C|nr:hypothetical protein [Catellatospora sichuanensis]
MVDPSDIAMDTEAGINLYVALTEDSRLNMIRDAGSYAMTNTRMGNGAESVAWMLADEFDMTGGPGDGAVKGDACESPDTPCGYTQMEKARASFPKDGRMRYANYGKGVTFWETDAQAARFVNEYQDVVSADNYWFTDRNVCIPSEGGTFFMETDLVDGRLPEHLCHRAANYGLTMDRVRELVSPAGSKPVWAFVEVGHPSGSDQDAWPTIKPDEIVAAVWSSLIHGARGIIYFNHSFGGPCPSHNVLRERCYAKTRDTVIKLNAQIKRLAPVLNAPFAINAVTASPGVDVATKWHDNQYHVLAGSKQHTSQTADFQLACTGDGTATVIDEGRTLPIKNGRFTDAFKDGNAVHLYEINVPGCGYSAG